MNLLWVPPRCLLAGMYNPVIICVFCLLSSTTVLAAVKPHVIALGKISVVTWHVGPDYQQDTLRVRPLLVDGKLKDFTTGSAHEVTERTFVIRRALRVNDSLPGEKEPQWKWERGPWLMIDRLSGRITPLSLPDFDPDSSEASWYRDYVAYCASPTDADQVTVVVAQIGRRKPWFRKAVEARTVKSSNSSCPRFFWSRDPARVAFDLRDGKVMSFTIRAGIFTVSADEDDSPSD